MIIQKLVVGCVLLVGAFLFHSGTAEAAICGGDLWGGRVSTITGKPDYIARIGAQTTINHLSNHSSCSGTFYARASLDGGGCDTSATATQPHGSSDPTETHIVGKDCTVAPGYSYKTNGTHGGFGEELDGTESQTIYFSVENPDPCAECQDEQCECECVGGWWQYPPEAPGECNMESPLMIDPEHNGAGYHLTTAEDGVSFDIDNDGFKDRVAWTRTNSAVAFIVLDRNSNGAIDSGGELFGNHTLKRDGTRARNGFLALADLDLNGDRKITREDAAFALLRVWTDRNHNGTSEPPEIRTLDEAQITTLFTEYRDTPRCDGSGNRYKYAGTALVLGASGNEVLRRMFDVFLHVAR